jgi:phosphoribosylformylglycinamidine synthase subunit PurS
VPRVRVLIRPKEGILDPQGKAVERALPALGFADVHNVHVGRLVELDVDDVSEVEAMCERLLANTLIEDFEVTLVRPEAEQAHSRGSG